MARNSKYDKIFTKLLLIVIMLLSPISLYAGNVTLTWDPPTTNADGSTLTDLAGYKIHYGIESGIYTHIIDIGNVPEYQINNLTEGTTYYFVITVYDLSVPPNESVFSNELGIFISTIDTTSPVITDVQSANITSSSANISWTTDEASDTRIEYGFNTSYGNTTTLDSSLVTSHDQSINGLLSSTLYHYRVISRDGSGNEALSGDYTFTTSEPPPMIHYYCDSDNDGHMDVSTDGACSGDGCVPSGCQTTPGNDCDDNTSNINPAAADSDCNGIDNNCDGTPDNNYSPAHTSCGTGECQSTGQLVCQSGSEVDTCVPNSPEENPETTCDDGIDNDCNGLVDEGCSPHIKVGRVLLHEDFSSGIPETWRVQGAWNTDNPCSRYIDYPFEGHYTIVDSSCMITGIDELETGSIDTSFCNSIELEFTHQYYWYAENIDVDISDDGGATWTNAVSISADDGYPTPSRKNIDISSLANAQDARVNFTYSNNAADGFWAIDNLWVSCQSNEVDISGQVDVPTSKTMMITNTGAAVLGINTIEITGNDSLKFYMGENDSCSYQTLVYCP